MDEVCSLKPQVDNLQLHLKQQQRAIEVLYGSLTPQQQTHLSSEYPELPNPVPDPTPPASCTFPLSVANNPPTTAASVGNMFQNPPSYPYPGGTSNLVNQNSNRGGRGNGRGFYGGLAWRGSSGGGRGGYRGGGGGGNRNYQLRGGLNSRGGGNQNQNGANQQQNDGQSNANQNVNNSVAFGAPPSNNPQQQANSSSNRGNFRSNFRGRGGRGAHSQVYIFDGSNNYHCQNCLAENQLRCDHCFHCGESGHRSFDCPLN